MIHYHGGPISPTHAGFALWKARHAMISFAYPDQISFAAELCQSFCLDNGAFTFWKQGVKVTEAIRNMRGYAEWVKKWSSHPGFDWCLIPDDIEGGENENDIILSQWLSISPVPVHLNVPVWHFHESNERLKRLCSIYHRVALGSSGDYSEPGSEKWWERISDAMDFICTNGIPAARLHGLRMLNPTIFSQLPLSSADSTNVARNVGLDSRWDTAAYAPKSPSMRAMILAERIESHAAAATWQRTNGTQNNLELIG